jgi:hypothetical protein
MNIATEMIKNPMGFMNDVKLDVLKELRSMNPAELGQFINDYFYQMEFTGHGLNGIIIKELEQRKVLKA